MIHVWAHLRRLHNALYKSTYTLLYTRRAIANPTLAQHYTNKNNTVNDACARMLFYVNVSGGSFVQRKQSVWQLETHTSFADEEAYRFHVGRRQRKETQRSVLNIERCCCFSSHCTNQSSILSSGAALACHLVIIPSQLDSVGKGCRVVPFVYLDRCCCYDVSWMPWAILIKLMWNIH